MTHHFAGTVQVPPVVIDPDGAGAAGGWMVLVQTEGSNADSVCITERMRSGSTPYCSALKNQVGGALALCRQFREANGRTPGSGTCVAGRNYNRVPGVRSRE